MVNLNFDLNMSIPLLDDAERALLFRRAQSLGTAQARKRIATPSRKLFPNRTRVLRRSFRAGRPRRSRRISRHTYVALEFRYRFYGPFQEQAFLQFRANLMREAPDIIRDAMAEAIRERS